MLSLPCATTSFVSKIFRSGNEPADLEPFASGKPAPLVRNPRLKMLGDAVVASSSRVAQSHACHRKQVRKRERATNGISLRVIAAELS